jgi:hypothetical protein
MTKFRKFYPFDFQLLNDQGEHAFFIQDKSENITLSITNQGTKEITFHAISGDASASNYHFMLRLRPGTIINRENILLNAEKPPKWELKTGNENGQDLLFFRYMSDDGKGIKVGGALDLELDKLMADTTLGSRDSNVELICDNMSFADSLEVLRATRQVKWPIISHRGSKSVPLHVGFLGSNTILNNGDANVLTLRVSLAHQKDSILFKSDPNDSIRSKVIITFDTGKTEQEWTIADSAKIFKLSVPATSVFLVKKDEQIEPVEFEIYVEHDFQMRKSNGPDDASFFDIKLADIETNHPSGLTNCYVRIENIPGYWDHSFVCPIQKQPMVFSGDNVGIGTNKPLGPLHIVSNGTNNPIKFHNPEMTEGKGGGSIFGMEFGKSPHKNNMAEFRFNYRGLNSPDNFINLGLWANANSLVVKGNGNIGIGTTEPKAKLQVNGAAIINKNLDVKGELNVDGAAILNNKLELKKDAHIDGNVGIGTTKPEEKLEVYGSVKIQPYSLKTDNKLPGNPAVLIIDNQNGNAFSFLKSQHKEGDWSTAAKHEDGGYQIHNSVTKNVVMYILPDGNMGIGHRNPEEKLDVHGVVKANSFRATNEMVHRMYPSKPIVYQDIFTAKEKGAIYPCVPLPAGYNGTSHVKTKWNGHRIINFGNNKKRYAKINVPKGYDTVWVRVLGDRWSVIQTYSEGWKERWCGGHRLTNPYCPDGSLSDGYYNVHQWLPIPVRRSGEHAIRLNTDGGSGDFNLSGLAFSANPWKHATQSAIGYHWAVNGGDKVSWQKDSWKNDVLAMLTKNTNHELMVPVIPSGQDKLLYLIEHNNDWNGCMHTGITVNGKPIERFTATYDNPFARHWNSKMYERYIAARIPAYLIPDGAKHLSVRVDMRNQNNHIHFREIGTHDLDVPEYSI